MSSMAEQIEHIGTISAVKEGMVSVEFLRVSACSSCHAKGVCTTAESENRVIEVPTTRTDFAIGQRVKVVGSFGMGMTAVLWAFIVPFVLMITVLVCCSQKLSEMASGVIAIGSLAPYYFILFFFRKKLEKKLSFSVESA